MKVLVCGGRSYKDQDVVDNELNTLHLNGPIDEVICGGASGADNLAILWAVRHKIKTNVLMAEWSVYGKAAGSIRNQKMLDSAKPDIVLVFPGSRGTADMRRRAILAGLPIVEKRSGL